MFNADKRQKIIINADDFGKSSAVNSAIIYAFNNQLISSATIMANMPGFDEACDLIHKHRLNGKIGVHLNITEGKPLTQRLRNCKRLCLDDGEFKGLEHRRFCLLPEEVKAIREEFEAQVKSCLYKGIYPTHIDSHNHYHTWWSVGSAAIWVAKRFEIKAIRLARNSGEHTNLAYKCYRKLFNARLRLHELAKVKYFGQIEDVKSIINYTDGPIEVMVHPDINHQDSIIDASATRFKIDNLLSTRVNSLGSRGPLISYSELV